MARKCPNCLATVPATKVLVYTNDLFCPTCNSPLQVSALSRNISAFAALIVAAIVWRIASAYYFGHPGASAGCCRFCSPFSPIALPRLWS